MFVVAQWRNKQEDNIDNILKINYDRVHTPEIYDVTENFIVTWLDSTHS